MVNKEQVDYLLDHFNSIFTKLFDKIVNSACCPNTLFINSLLVWPKRKDEDGKQNEKTLNFVMKYA